MDSIAWGQVKDAMKVHDKLSRRLNRLILSGDGNEAERREIAVQLAELKPARDVYVHEKFFNRDGVHYGAHPLIP